MTRIRRLAVLDRGEVAVRLLAAVAELNREAAGTVPAPPPVTTVAVVTGAGSAWSAREADEVLEVGEADGDAPARAVLDAGADAVWVGAGAVADPAARADLVARFEDAGVTVVGPSAATLRLLCSPDGLRSAAASAGVPDRWPDGAVPPAVRRVDVDVVTDGAGTTWVLGSRDTTVRYAGRAVLVESAAPGLPDPVRAVLHEQAERLVDRLGQRGVVAVRFEVAEDAVRVAGLAVPSFVDQTPTEEVGGVDLVALHLDVAAGGRPVPPPDEVAGHAVQVRLTALDVGVDTAGGGTVTPGRLLLLDVPAVAGVRVDDGLRAGDAVTADSPVLATLTAWGRTRAQALARLRRALSRTAAVVDGGTTDRAFLLAVLAHPDLAAGPVDAGWLDRLVARGAFDPPPDAVAVLAAAAEAYDADRAAAEAAFHARAARGRPEPPEAVGTRVVLGYRGGAHALRVDLVAPGRYRVGDPDGAADVVVERLGAFERRLVCGGRRHRVVVATHGSVVRVEVDDTAHVLTREDGVVVRAGWPAFVVEVLVAPGDHVQAGKPVAVLESMKMESVVPAPFSGEVLGVDVVANAQVEAGAGLLRLRADDLRSRPSVEPVAAQPVPLGLRELARPEDPGLRPCERVYGPLREYLLGYDLDPTTLTRLLAAQRRLAELSPPDDGSLLACEDSLLGLYADLGALSRPRSENDDADDGPEAEAVRDARTGSAQEYLIAFLRFLDADRAMLPGLYRERLRVALDRYGVTSLDRTPELESAVVRLYRSIGRVRELAPVVVAVLARRLAAADVLAATAGPRERSLLDRLAAATQGRQQDVADLARDVRFHLLDEPVLESVVADVYAEMEGHLLALHADPLAADRAHRVDRLVLAPHPMRAALLRHWLTAGDGTAGEPLRRTLLEVYVRRFYRIRPLRDLRTLVVGGHLVAAADYTHDGRDVHLVVAYAPLEDLPSVADAVGEHLVAPAPGTPPVPASTDVVLDVVTWQAGERPEIDATAAAVADLLGAVDVGRRLHRLDVTVTSTAGGSKEHFRTQHLTFRQDASGAFVEDVLYRNLHPMLAKRLELWRLSGFRLDRLPSAEDVYLFHGVAHDNPKDSRLFALAEVRDLTAVRGEDGSLSYPRLERMGLQALAAMRAALAGFPARERPVANRIVLAVRPPWDVPRSAWAGLARSLAPLASGAGLEKVVLRVRIPGPAGPREAVLHLEGVGGHGVTVRVEAPGDAPVRALSAYQQKVLLAARFGVPYPYEVVRLLASAEGTPGLLPPGSFVEHDLDAADRLVPVDRPPGENSAHVVVGLVTNRTDVVPEGMTRVAILSDPTKGLGNLAEPECRRINAALDLAASLGVPVEWFAVSSGALIAMDSGTENMDWIAATLRRIIEFTQDGGEINIVVTGINVGGQPYWNAEATMLMHTRGILVMTPSSAMVLTGKQALDFSGGVSAEDNFGIGGHDRVMGPNGQAQYWAPTFLEACGVLLRHYELTYVVPGERFPRRRPTSDPLDRDVRPARHVPVPGSDFTSVGDVFDPVANPDRKKPFDIRSVMRAVADADTEPLERWEHWRDAENAVVWDTCVGGIPVCLLGIESRTVPRRGFVPADGPPAWTSGTLFPQASRKTARAVNAVAGRRPLVVLANLSGFDGSPESMRRWQLEYGAEIGRAVTNFDGPIVFVVVSRYHGGAFVVFSKALNARMEIAAVEGSYASVIGGAPAAATVFAREVKARTDRDTRVTEVRERLATAKGAAAGRLRVELARATERVRSEKLGEVADEFDGIHTIERALRVGSVDRIIAAQRLRPYVVDALERGMAQG
ncbi:carboxyl transferase domain-containing protein [Kineosporia sp. R_H_3]|uniref:carboxyl transferase domain-containing protein n=1 Tax=Kineosporia sp. R_H_3 TaxID=1961848 RepID=UPI0013042A4B|nr:carboxyl transferase domain-containing protein [Kineosporia sp. R_H_3]